MALSRAEVRTADDLRLILMVSVDCWSKESDGMYSRDSQEAGLGWKGFTQWSSEKKFE